MNMRRKSKIEKASKPKTAGKSVRLSNSKAKKIEKGIRMEIKQSRKVYLSAELDKYKNIIVAYD